ncbi:hypothetical protein K9L67_01285 [Candidatus Woesearchaeota archaeon]|nr:hypothetical protein [Candidatus Woesearchaeota archaeon]MCF7900837.1 hypothetical protein [Candidatus Woesearchaeota archaeon]MCF8013841.1 hypothetical protein [Candidatus Woesearchaeota archaeon]
MLEELLGSGMGPGILFLVGFFFILVVIGAYVYSSLAFMAIGKKAKNEVPALAWIPAVGPLLVAYFALKKRNSLPWWIGLGSFVIYILGIIFLAIGMLNEVFLILGIILLVLSIVGFIYFYVYSYIWTWKLFEKIKKPGWWALISLFALPFVLMGYVPGLEFVSLIAWIFNVWYLVVIGIAAWSKN